MKKGIKRTLISIGSVVGVLILGIIVYAAYILLSYYRIGNTALEINHNSDLTQVKVDTTYSCTTYNIGFGAYSQDYTFFMDTGYDDEGNETVGYYSKAKSKDEVLFNTNGAISTVSSLGADFMFLQEVDIDSTRSYHINQNKMITDAFTSYDNDYAVNFHTAFLPYPIYDMHGSVKSSITTLSRYKLQSAQRKEYTVSTSLSKLFDLDRCFSVSTVQVENGKTLYLVNSHMSAYDKGGTIREKQMEELNTFLEECKRNGDYVIVGGDFNHDLITYNPDYTYNDDSNRAFGMTKKTPDWVASLFNKDGTSPLTSGYRVVASDNTPTCRNNDIQWEPGETFVCTVDGFIVSDNIDVEMHHNVLTTNGNKGVDGFAFSDHQPAYMTFRLK
jgi:endonuclease/exonuclease/phosphatase family metal-dependent hydrolase